MWSGIGISTTTTTTTGSFWLVQELQATLTLFLDFFDRGTVATDHLLDLLTRDSDEEIVTAEIIHPTTLGDEVFQSLLQDSELGFVDMVRCTSDGDDLPFLPHLFIPFRDGDVCARDLLQFLQDRTTRTHETGQSSGWDFDSLRDAVRTAAVEHLLLTLPWTRMMLLWLLLLLLTHIPMPRRRQSSSR